MLPVLLGRATRLADYVQSGTKTYVATVQLGIATETDDAEGTITQQAPVPPLTDTLLDATLPRFTGEILQTPPAYSALKVDGQRAYALARRGTPVALAPRPVTIHSLRLLEHTESTLEVEVTCAKGTYIRALARDVARALGTVGHMSTLLRTRVGPFTLNDSLTLDHIATHGVPNVLLSAANAVPDAPKSMLSLEDARKYMNGQPIDHVLQAPCVWVYDPDAQLLGLGVADGNLLRPRIAL